MGILANENAISSGGYQISNSLRFQNASSNYLSRTVSSTSNRQKWTWSAWVKRGQLSTTTRNLFAATDNTTASTFWGFGSYSSAPADTIFFYTEPGLKLLYTSAVFRDPSAWYHIVISVDTTQATAANRVIIYVNNVQQTLSGSYPAQNDNLQVNATGYLNTIGSYWTNLYFFDGYQAEMNLIDGQQLTPSSFGETNTLTGQWVAKKYTGTYGTNGFYLPFSNGTSTTTLGADSSGNGNNWTLTNFTRSAGTSDCWMYDVPSGNGGASGTQPSSNYCVLNPLDQNASTVTAGNLRTVIATNASPNGMYVSGSIGVTSGKYYWEAIYTSGSNELAVGVIDANSTFNTTIFTSGVGYFALNGNKYVSGTPTSYGATYTSNDVIGVALDLDAGTVTFYKNNTSQGSITLPTGVSAWKPSFANGTRSASQTFNANFGNRSFAYTPPSGFKALCTANLPASTIVQGNQYMNATTYTGTGSAQTINVGFQPDWVWIKSRSGATNNWTSDSVRGASNFLITNSTSAEATYPTLISAYTSNGFTLGTDIGVNNNGATYVAWDWQAGQGTTSSNTNGSITSTVSVNATAGFSIVTYTGTGANATVGHGLGVAPAMIICKCRTQVADWPVYHTGIGATKYMNLNQTNAASVTSAPWNNTAPTSSVFTVGTSYGTNWPSNSLVAYCFAEIAGFSKFGSYTGNSNADGAFVYTGFRPKYVMIKNAGLADNWCMYDTSRNPYNVTNLFLTAQASTAEQTGLEIDILSNGFKARTTNDNVNSSSYSYIYMAFAENPFAQANAR